MTSRGRYFRAGVGAVILDSQGRVLALERSDRPGAWQLPQGGLEDGEESLTAVLREIEEEVGLKKETLELITRYPEPLVYELPVDAQSAKTGMGQVQYWFLFRYKGKEKDIQLPKDGEFAAWSWLPFNRLLHNAVAFRRPVYQRLKDHFQTHLAS